MRIFLVEGGVGDDTISEGRRGSVLGYEECRFLTLFERSL
jgi:hypothetical protein